MPYKRYAAPDIEKVLEEKQPVELDADNSTLYRLKKWFQKLAPYLLGCLKSISLRLKMNTVKEQSVLSQSVHQKIGHYVGNGPGWLAIIVRPVVNANLWIHTRSAFLSANTWARL